MTPDSMVRSLVQHARALMEGGLEPNQSTACLPLLDVALQHASSLPDGPQRDAHLGIVYATRGDALRQAGQADAAVAEYGLACARFAAVDDAAWPSIPQFAEGYVRALLQTGASERAAALLLDKPHFRVKDEAFVEVARYRSRAGDADGAMALLLASAGKNDGANRTWAEFNVMLDTQAAREALARSVCKPTSVLEHHTRTRLLDIVQDRLASTPDDLDLRIVRGILLDQKGDNDGAVNDLSAAVARRPGDRPVALALARLLLRIGRSDTARNVLAHLSDHATRDEKTRLLLAEALAQSDDGKSAVEVLHDVLASEPGSETALQSRATALARLGRRDEALALLDESLGRNPNQAEAWKSKALILIAAGRPAEAGEAIAGGLTRLDDQSVGALYLRQAEAYLAARQIERADNALGLSLKLAPEPEIADMCLLSRVLDGLGRSEEALSAADRGLAASAAAPDLLIAKAHALRHLGRQTEALRVITALARSEQSGALSRLHSLLLCDVGDFQGALDVLRPLTEPVAGVDHDLLSIRGWAHQNLEGVEHATEAERAYRSACRQQPNELWYRKGLANALRRIPGRLAEALEQYGAVIAECERRRAAHALTPHLQCLAAWSFCQRGDAEAAADWYTAALSRRRIGVSVQFDYALVLLAGGHGGAAFDEYTRTIEETRAKDVLRQCGLLYVALIDVRAAQSATNVIASAAASNVAHIKKILRDALLAAAGQVPQDFGPLARAMGEFVRHDELSSSPDSNCPDWSQFDVRGFHRPDPEVDLALLLPVVSHRGDSYLLQPDQPPTPLPSERLKQLTEAGEVIALPVHERAFPESRVLFVAGKVLTAIGLDVVSSHEDGLMWHALDTPVHGWACITSTRHGEAMLRSLGEKIAEVAIARIVRSSTEADVEKSEVLDLARLALRTASDEQVAYRALLAYGVAGGNVSAMVDSLRDGQGARWHMTASQAEAAVQGFVGLLDLRKQRDVVSSSSRTDPPPETFPTDPLAKRVMERAERIHAIRDADEQFHEALRAATEVEAIVPLTDVFETTHRDLAARLTSEAMFYLESDDSILLLGREPAFYSAAVPLKRRPAVNSFAFAKATTRLRDQERTFLGQNRRSRLL